MLSDYIQPSDVDGEFFKQKIMKISNDVDLISNGLELVGQQFVRMRDIRWRKKWHTRFVGNSCQFIEIWISWLCGIVKKGCAFLLPVPNTKALFAWQKCGYGTSTWEYLERSFVNASAKHWALLSQLYELQWWSLTMTTSVDLLEWYIHDFTSTLSEPWY